MRALALALACCPLLLLLAGPRADAVASKKWDKLSVTWSLGGFLSYLTNNAFYELPLTADLAQKQKWVQARAEEHVALWCLPNDPRVCTLYDQQGNIAGLQISFPTADLEGTPYDWTQHKLFFGDTILGQQVVSGRFYLVPQEVLQSGGRATVDEIGSGLWLQDGDGFTDVPLDAAGLVEQGWTKENCIPTMGRHYYYNITDTMDCRDFEPYFIMTDDSKSVVHGLGFQTFGKKSKQSRDWEESVPGLAIKPTLPNAPQCLVDWANNYGVLSVHVYFFKSPYTYWC